MAPRITGLNHITLAVRELDRSIAFYRDILGCHLRATWEEGAYFEAGPLWLCLMCDDTLEPGPRPDYSHVAFSVTAADYPALRTAWRPPAGCGETTGARAHRFIFSTLTVTSSNSTSELWKRGWRMIATTRPNASGCWSAEPAGTAAAPYTGFAFSHGTTSADGSGGARS